MKIGIGIVVFILLIIPVSTSGSLPIERISTTSGYYLVIYGDHVVWTENENGGEGISAYSFRNSTSFNITPKFDARFYSPNHLSLYENQLVWKENRYWKDQIFTYNFSIGKEKIVLNNSIEKRSPSIYKHLIAWVNDNGSISIFNQTSQNETIFQMRYNATSVKMYDDNLVYSASSEGSNESFSNRIYRYNLNEQSTVQIGTDRSSDFDIYENKIVYEEFISEIEPGHSNVDIYMYDINTNVTIPICTNQWLQYKPAIYDNTVVWIDSRHGYLGIYAYDLRSNQEIQIWVDGNVRGEVDIHESIIAFNGWDDTWGVFYTNITWEPIQKSDSISDIHMQYYSIIAGILILIVFFIFVIKRFR